MNAKATALTTSSTSLLSQARLLKRDLYDRYLHRRIAYFTYHIIYKLFENSYTQQQVKAAPTSSAPSEGTSERASRSLMSNASSNHCSFFKSLLKFVDKTLDKKYSFLTFCDYFSCSTRETGEKAAIPGVQFEFRLPSNGAEASFKMNISRSNCFIGFVYFIISAFQAAKVFYLVLSILNNIFRIYYQIKQQISTAGPSTAVKAPAMSSDDKQPQQIDEARVRVQSSENERLYAKLGFMLRQLNHIDSLDCIYLHSFVMQLVENENGDKMARQEQQQLPSSTSLATGQQDTVAQFSSSSLATSVTDEEDDWDGGETAAGKNRRRDASKFKELKMKLILKQFLIFLVNMNEDNEADGSSSRSSKKSASLIGESLHGHLLCTLSQIATRLLKESLSSKKASVEQEQTSDSNEIELEESNKEPDVSNASVEATTTDDDHTFARLFSIMYRLASAGLGQGHIDLLRTCFIDQRIKIG